MDLIERLRDVSGLEDIDHDICYTAYEAAMEIEELRDVIRRVREEAQRNFEENVNASRD